MSDEAIRLLGSTLAENVGGLTVRTAAVHTTSPLQLRGADGEPVTVQHTTGWAINAGEQVLTLRDGATVWVIGPVSPSDPPPQTGIVASVSGSLATVALGDPYGSVALPSTVTVAATQRVAIMWQRTGTDWTGVIVGVITVNPGTAPPPPPPPPTEGDGHGTGVDAKPANIRAVTTASWRQGWRTDTTNLYQGNAGAWSSRPYPQRGFWFYGNGAFDDLRGRVVTGTKLEVRTLSGAGASAAVPVRFRLHTAPTRPGGMPTLLADEWVVNLKAGEGRTGKKALTPPNSFIQKLADGAAHGIAVVSDSTAEYRGISGLVSHGASGQLTITTEAP